MRTTPISLTPPSGTAARRERIAQILDGQVDLDPQQNENSALQAMKKEGPPNSQELATSWPRALLLSTLLLIVMLAAHPLMDFAWIVAGIALVGCAFAESIAMYRKHAKVVRAWNDKLGAALEEVKDARSFLHEYLDQLDKRTSKYFHCVTNTKVTTYCILRQVLTSLEGRIAAVAALLDSSNPTSLEAAYHRLQEALAFKDGFLQNVGKQHFLALPQVRPAINLLIEDLDCSLLELEDEIRH